MAAMLEVSLQAFARGLVSYPAALVATAALLSVAAWLLLRALPTAREVPGDAAILALLIVAAGALRLMIPHGALHFAEADRVRAAWSAFSGVPPHASSDALLGLLRGLGVPAAALLRWSGPVAGSVGVGLAWALARALGLSRACALLTALTLMLWPAHIRYSASMGLIVPGATVWTALVLVTVSPRLGPAWKVTLSSALLVLGVHLRPEYRLLAAACLPLFFAPGWTWRMRLAAAGLLAPAMAPYLVFLSTPGQLGTGAGALSQAVIEVRALVATLDVNPLFCVVAGLVGLLAGRLPHTVRAAALLLVAALVAQAVWMGNETNPLLHHSRYYVTCAPFLGLGLGLASSRLAAWVEGVFRSRAAGLAVTGAVGFFVVADAWALRNLVSRAVDLQVETAFIEDTAEEISAAHEDLAVVTWRSHHGITPAVHVAMGISAATGSDRSFWDACEGPAERAGGGVGAPRVWSLESVLRACPGAPAPEEVALYLGLLRPPEVMKGLLERFRLEPLKVHEVSAAPATRALNSFCPIDFHDPREGPLPDCELELGWYRVRR